MIDPATTATPGLHEAFLHRVHVAPNCSLSWRAAALVYGWIAFASLGIAVALAFAGYWPVLPFAGLEVAALGAALWVTMRRGAYREVISVYDGRVVVEKGTPDNRDVIEFPRHWAHVNLRRARIPSHPSRLTIGSHGRFCEIGRCLTETERLGLHRRLGEMIGTVNQTPLPEERAA